METEEDAAWFWAEVEEAVEFISTSTARMAEGSRRNRCALGVPRKGDSNRE